uniref:DUF4216 domain-containing protein n=1 Tax=Triticum urartu TaxID=4572 RepID=A0A8R7V062_TRIUA
MGHRRWLPQNHVFRRRKKEFDNTEEMELAPITMSGSSALRMLQGRVFVLGKKVIVAKKGKGKKKGKDSEKGTEDYKVVFFKCDWYDVHHKAGIIRDEFGFTHVNFSQKIH